MEQRSTYVEGFGPLDLFTETSGIMLGRNLPSFTVAILGRDHPLDYNSDVAYDQPVMAAVDSEAAPTAGYWFRSSRFGPAEVEFWDSGGANTLLSGTDEVGAFASPGASGASSLALFIVDADADVAQLWLNGCLMADAAAPDFAPAPEGTVTVVGSLTVSPAAPTVVGNRPGISGLGFAPRALTAAEIEEHWNLVMEKGSFESEPFTYAWDARQGMPVISTSTTQWIDEVSSKPLTRLTQNDNYSLSVAAGRPRFR